MPWCVRVLLSVAFVVVNRRTARGWRPHHHKDEPSFWFRCVCQKSRERIFRWSRRETTTADDGQTCFRSHIRVTPAFQICAGTRAHWPFVLLPRIIHPSIPPQRDRKKINHKKVARSMLWGRLFPSISNEVTLPNHTKSTTHKLHHDDGSARHRTSTRLAVATRREKDQ